MVTKAFKTQILNFQVNPSLNKKDLLPNPSLKTDLCSCLLHDQIKGSANNFPDMYVIAEEMTMTMTMIKTLFQTTQTVDPVVTTQP